MIDYRFLIVFLVILFLSVFVYLIITFFKVYPKQSLGDFVKHTKCWVINLPKNTDRLERFKNYYNKSDIKQLEFERFEAINGKEIDINQFVTEKALTQIQASENTGYRLKHYELTRGAVGCFLSHMTLYEKLLEDPNHDLYIIFEDDVVFASNFLKPAYNTIQYAPKDWDLITFGAIREDIDSMTLNYIKYRVFWGLFGYAINKKGAKKIVDEYKSRHIDMQIDSLMSVMSIEKRFNVYGITNKLAWHGRSMGTDIQLPVKKVSNIDPFDFE
jgi:GR25 family glycosyltransferase involved in LPS biosynthesis